MGIYRKFSRHAELKITILSTEELFAAHLYDITLEENKIWFSTEL